MKQRISGQLLILFFLAGFVHLSAQDYLPGEFETFEEHSLYFKTIREAHQELLRRESPILLTYGYQSPEHLQLRDSIQHRNALLLAGVNSYLDAYGFPRTPNEVLELREVAQKDLFKRLLSVPSIDSLARDSILQIVRSEYRGEVSSPSLVPIVMLILQTETDFYRRCEMLPLLRFEWEEENLSTMSMLAYLRHTHVVQQGKELDIATGATERDRIYMYGQALSGCWVN